MRLADRVSRWLDDAIALPRRRQGFNEWLEGDEGKIYIRYNGHLDRIDLSNFSIWQKYQRQGVASEIITIATTKPAKIIRIENILNTEWAAKVREYVFPNRVTVVEEIGFGITVDFRRP